MRPLVKICGVRRIDDARLAADLGAAAIGMVFWPASPRWIDPYRARPIVAALPPFVTPVGVFVNQPPEYVAGVAGLLKLGAVQLHGDEDPSAYAGVRVRIIKALPVSNPFDPGRAVSGIADNVTVLLDAHDPKRHGGTGRTIDWTHAALVARRRRIILSGGLDASNVGEALAQVTPYAVDVSSGVESAPGIKSAERLRAFFAAVEAASVNS